jgi:predicted MPP superfamily phosphohydrolase
VWAAYGFWRAFHPVIRPLEVRLETLPDRWRNRTIVQISDVHLGHFHTPADILRDDTPDRRTTTYWRPDTSFALNRDLGVSLQLSGHTHKGQMFPFGYLTGWIYSGLDYGLHHKDGFSLYTSSGVGTWGPPMRTGTAPEIVVLTLK